MRERQISPVRSRGRSSTMPALAVCRFVLRLARCAVVAGVTVVIASALLYQAMGSPLLHIMYKPLPHAGEASIYVPGKSFSA